MKRGLAVLMLIAGGAWLGRRWRAIARWEGGSRAPVRSFDPDDPSDLNEALRTYLGSTRGNRGVKPWGNEERVRETYGVDAEAALAAVRRIIDAIHIPEEIEQSATLQEIGSSAEMAAHALGADLDEDVCQAIGNYVSYSYR